MPDQINLGQGDERPALTPRQIEVLRLRCNGYGYKKIAQELSIEKNTVSSHMRDIYERLGLMDLEATERQWRIREEICPALKRDEFPITPDEEEADLEPVSTEDEEKLDEDEGVITKWKEKSSPPPIPPPSTRPRIVNRPRPSIWLIVGFILGLIAMYIAYPSLFASVPQEIAEVAIPAATEVVVVEQQTVIVTTTPQIAISTSEPQAVVVTATPPIPTPTPELVVVQPPGFVFSDDFEDGPDPLWEVIYGEPGMANGDFTALSAFDKTEQSDHLAVLTEHYWENFRITFELLPFVDLSVTRANEKDDARLGILFHYEEGTSPIAGFLIFPSGDGLEFGYFQNRQWELQASSHIEPEDFSQRNTTFMIEGSGNTYKVFIDGLQVSSAALDGPSRGNIALWIITSRLISEPEYFAPRIENLTIESLP